MKQKNLFLILAVVVVLYLLVNSQYKSNAIFDLAPAPFVPPTAAQVAAAQSVLANATMAAPTPTDDLIAREQAMFNKGSEGPGLTQAQAQAMVNDKFGPGVEAYKRHHRTMNYSTNAFRDWMPGSFVPPTAEQVEAAKTVLAAANVAAPTASNALIATEQAMFNKGPEGPGLTQAQSQAMVTASRGPNAEAYKTNAYVNRKAWAGKFQPPTAAQTAAAFPVLQNARVAAPTASNALIATEQAMFNKGPEGPGLTQAQTQAMVTASRGPNVTAYAMKTTKYSPAPVNKSTYGYGMAKVTSGYRKY
jgi:hypothetical protein